MAQLTRERQVREAKREVAPKAGLPVTSEQKGAGKRGMRGCEGNYGWLGGGRVEAPSDLKL